jgi:phosphatidylserine/phosphatidylglycerophosphate/cardiolipin synthase-like enzyme
MQTYTIYKDEDYYLEVAKQVAATKSGDRIAIITMTFWPEEQLIRPIFEELIKAAKRGVRIDLAIDAFAFMMTQKDEPIGPLFFNLDPAKTKLPRRFYLKMKALNEFSKAGGHYYILNKPTHWPTNPTSGRSHIKATVINDEVYVGGCNFGDSNQIDYMVRIRNAETTEWIYEMIHRIAKNGNSRRALDSTDLSLNPDTDTEILVDSGVKRQSLILDTALDFIDQSQKWLVITCQYYPGGMTADHIDSAHKRGVKVYPIYNNTNKFGAVESLVHSMILERERLRHSKALFNGQLPRSHKRLHAKLIATENGAMIGSHNYVDMLVRRGTAEIAILRHDPDFAIEAVSILLRQLKVNDGSRFSKPDLANL